MARQNIVVCDPAWSIAPPLAKIVSEPTLPDQSELLSLEQPGLALLDPPAQKLRRPHLLCLSLCQKSVFNRIDAVPGRGETARRTVQGLLAELVGDRVSAALIQALSLLLLDRGWGVQCLTCGRPSTPFCHTFQRRNQTREVLKCSHRDSGGRAVTHAGRILVPEFTLVERHQL